MTTALAPDSLRTIRRVWAERLGIAEGPLVREGVSAVSWEATPAASAVRIADTTILGAPPRALEKLTGCSPATLLDPAALVSALDGLEPVLFGAAQLAYLDAGTFTPAPSLHAAAADGGAIERMLDALPARDRDESGLAGMERFWVVRSTDGTAVAAAGYETWSAAIAHIGVAVAPDARGNGLGAAVASAAAAHALGAGLVVQWRSGLPNLASRRLGERLGAVPLGEQVTVDLAV